MSRTESSQRIVVVGAGLLGLATAAELARRGHAVTVLERAVPGAEASTAAAGILGPQLEHDDDGPTLALGVAGAKATRALVEQLRQELGAETGDVDYVARGAIKAAFDDHEARALERRVAWQQAKGLRAEWVAPADAGVGLGDGARLVARFPDDHCLDPKRYGAALHALAVKRGVTVVTGVPVARVLVDGRVTACGVLLEDGRRIEGDAVVVCAGAWSARVPSVRELAGLAEDTVAPVRGQIVELRGAPGALPCVVYGGGAYAVPRSDGRVVCGSTTEHVGFEKTVTAAGVHGVLSRVLRALPALGGHALSSTWAGLRPSTQDGLPLLGESRTAGLWLNTGHYRNGVLLAAVSAEILGALLDEEPVADRTGVDVAPFSPKRLR